MSVHRKNRKMKAIYSHSTCRNSAAVDFYVCHWGFFSPFFFFGDFMQFLIFMTMLWNNIFIEAVTEVWEGNSFSIFASRNWRLFFIAFVNCCWGLSGIYLYIPQPKLNRTKLNSKDRNQSQFVRQLAQLRRSAQVFPFAIALQLHQHQSEFATLTCHPHYPWTYLSMV